MNTRIHSTCRLYWGVRLAIAICGGIVAAGCCETEADFRCQDAAAPGDPGPRGVTVAADYQILVDREFGTEARLETEPFHSGEKLRLRIRPHQDCYAYVLNQGSSGAYTVLFPASRINAGSSYLESGQVVELPPKGGFQLDNETGHEKLTIFLSQRSHPELERLTRSGSAETASTDALLVRLEQANRRNSRLDRAIRGDYAQISLAAEKIDAVLVCRLTLRHESRQSSGTLPGPMADCAPSLPQLRGESDASEDARPGSAAGDGAASVVPASSGASGDSGAIAPAVGSSVFGIPLTKKCTGCGHDAGLGARVGQRCPRCGGIWRFERTVYVNR